ncbi:helix-turn-helix domain-containing protein [Streptomyces lichenis]|uniref:Helix-turn-helix domain-containing protein n=1 Tax=Streptomyces lichenis TaxID=2306967 RepID=A0ABT0IAP8_9ACTN|nr:helix-turn-helix domain-containing protein [Streptomyces lichenis]MCK8678370.1 helix-turn-helix domain-containing protein [Streptomyces lichenis]
MDTNPKTHQRRMDFGDALKGLLTQAGLSPSDCATRVGVSREAVDRWRKGEVAPRGTNADRLRQLVRQLRGELGETAGFDDTWHHLLESAQQEGADRRGSAEGRGELRKWLARFGAEDFVNSALHDRVAELQAMRDFVQATGSDAPSYLWWQGASHAGKSALIADFLKELREDKNLEVVGWFVPSTPGGTPSSYVTQKLVGRLYELLDRKQPAVPQDVTPEQLQKLFQNVAIRCANKGHRLLVIVDGLDRDAAWQAWQGGVRDDHLGLLSIPALLPYPDVPRPRRASKHDDKRTIRVIVSSLPVTEPPPDVPSDHPLRQTGVVRALSPVKLLPGYAAAQAREVLAPLYEAEPDRTIMGLLACAGSNLSLRDLTELARTERVQTERVLAVARCHRLGGGLDDGGHVLVPEPVLRAARERTDADLRVRCLDALHAWADDWQGRGWPASTPRYLLSHYPGLLDGQQGRRERYVLDPRRQTRMVAAGLTDEALGQLDLIAGTEDADLTLAARVAASRDLLTWQARPVPPYFPRLFALAGDTARARELALSAPKATDRAISLSKVVEVLGQEGRAGSGELAHETAHWAQHAMAADRTRTYAGGEPPSAELAHVGCRLRSSGHREAGVAVLRSVVACETMGWAARVLAAQELGTHCLVTLAERAEELSRGGPQEQAEALEAWAELVKGAGRDDKAFARFVAAALGVTQKDVRTLGTAAIRERVAIFCARLEPTDSLHHIDLLALGAIALVSGTSAPRSKQSRELAKEARKRLRAAFADPDRLSPADRAHLGLELSTTLARVVHALLVVGQPVAAKGSLDEVPDRLRTDVLGDDIREAAFAVLEPGGAVYSGAEAEPVEPAQVAAIEEALRRHPARGERLLAEAFGQWEGETAAVGGPVWRLPLTEALAADGQVEEAVRLAGGAGEAGLRARGLAAVSMGCSASGAAAEAARYAREAAAEAEGLEDAVVRGAVAQALAHSGDAEAAERWTRGEGARGTSRHQDEQSRSAVAVGLAPYDSRASGRLVAERLAVLERSARAPYLRGRLLPEVAELLLALPEPRRPDARMRTALESFRAAQGEDIRSWDPRAVLVHALLDLGPIPHGSPPLGARLESWERSMAGTPHAVGPPVAEWAVLHAARGEVEAGCRIAERGGTSQERAAALAAVATCLAGVRTVVPAAQADGAQRDSGLGFLALAHALGPESAPDEERARHLVRQVLATEHWYYALPLLPRLAPDALPPLADLALTHLRLRPSD